MRSSPLSFHFLLKKITGRVDFFWQEKSGERQALTLLQKKKNVSRKNYHQWSISVGNALTCGRRGDTGGVH
jgi:hypothetical protein